MYRKLLTYTLLTLCAALPAYAQRRVTPVGEPQAVRQQPVAASKPDSTLVTAQGDTLPGAPPKMLQPLWNGAGVSVDLWDPLMRLTGQRYGVIGFGLHADLHNRYFPTVEFGFGSARKALFEQGYTFTAPVRPYLRIGADYNFLYNSDQAYKLLAGVRYGVTRMTYSLTDFAADTAGVRPPDVPDQRATVGWLELCLGLRVQISGAWSAGWALRYRSILHQPKSAYGTPWYIPGYGTGGLSASVSVYYTLPLRRKSEASVSN